MLLDLSQFSHFFFVKIYFIPDSRPTELMARSTSCGCANCSVLLFETCLDFDFHGDWSKSPLVVTEVIIPPQQQSWEETLQPHCVIAWRTCGHHSWRWALKTRSNYAPLLSLCQVLVLWYISSLFFGIFQLTRMLGFYCAYQLGLFWMQQVCAAMFWKPWKPAITSTTLWWRFQNICVTYTNTGVGNLT